MVYRQINQSYRVHYEHLMTSGLYDRLVDSGLLVAHEEVESAPASPATVYKLIKPRRVPFVSYPYEWCFSQLKDAALATLRIQQLALEQGMVLKDASAFNIQFVGGRPILIDTLSFETYTERQPWIAYGQFCRHFLAPLLLVRYVDLRLLTLTRTHLDGVPLDLASRLLPWRTWLRVSILIHVHLHARTVSRFGSRGATTTQRTITKNQLRGLVDSLESGISRLSPVVQETEWVNYYDSTNYQETDLQSKSKILERYLDRVRPATLLDLGANTGLFSQIAARRGIFTIACDVDPAAVESCYLQNHLTEPNIHPLLMDLTNPSPSTGWNHDERSSFGARAKADAIFCLALIHHLAISNNLPLRKIAQYLHQFGEWLIIEFVPKSDSQVERLLLSREDIFPDYTRQKFEETFGERFSIESCDKVGETERILYLMRARELRPA